MKKFRLLSLLTVLTVIVNVFASLAFLKPAAALSASTDTMSRLTAGTAAVTHTFTLVGATDNVVITFPASFTGTPATSSTDCSATGNVITCTSAQATVVVTGVTNPATVGSYTIDVKSGLETRNVQIPIVDSDTVDVTGYILSTMMFDLDTNTDNTHCAASGIGACLKEDTGAAASNYTVDLGNLTLAAINKSNVSVLHADGVTGKVNNIYFDLSTNAAAGAVVTMQSVGSRATYLDGPGTLTEDIPSVADGTTMTAGTAGYGYRWFNAPTAAGYGTGHSESLNASCSASVTTYCAIPATATSIWGSTTSAQEVRGYLEIAAAINGTMVPGTYNDTLRFIATATY